jgi:hypothetical protein
VTAKRARRKNKIGNAEKSLKNAFFSLTMKVKRDINSIRRFPVKENVNKTKILSKRRKFK